MCVSPGRALMTSLDVKKQNADRTLRRALMCMSPPGIYGYWSDTTAMDNLRGADITDSTVVSVCAVFSSGLSQRHTCQETRGENASALYLRAIVMCERDCCLLVLVQ